MNLSIRSAVLAATLAVITLPTSVMAQASDRAAVDQVVQKFLRAYVTADNTAAKEVFRKDGVMVGYSVARSNDVAVRTGEQFAEGFDGKPAANEAQRKRTYEIVDMAENFAAVRVNLDYPGWRGVDYLVLLKADGKWMIMSKSWTGVVTPRAS